MCKYRLLVLTSHPIQYQAPLFRALAARPEIDLEVCFYCRWGVEMHVDPQFGVPVAWDIPLVEGYRSRFLRNFGIDDGPKRFLSLFNPEVTPLCLSKRFDAVWIQGWATSSNWLAWLCAATSGKPLLLRGESNALEEPKGLKGAVKKAILGALFSRVSGFLAIGRLNESFYRGYGIPEERIFSVPYAVDNSFFIAQANELAPQRAALRSAYDIHAELPAVLFTGKLILKKRPLDLIRAFANAQTEVPSSLVLVGDGELRRDLEQFVIARRIPRVHFLGFRNQSEIGKLYALADLFILPSSSEPWGLSVNEAMCFGLPVIVSDQVGAGFDLVKPGINGYVYPARDVAALSASIRSALASRERLAAMGRESRKIVERWTIERSVEGIVRAVQCCVLGQSAPLLDSKAA
jgi:glycosyltransferase involved in cell wall biosynthesis